jgi:RNase P/RNase MRP subunit p29
LNEFEKVIDNMENKLRLNSEGMNCKIEKSEAIFKVSLDFEIKG